MRPDPLKPTDPHLVAFDKPGYRKRLSITVLTTKASKDLASSSEVGTFGGWNFLGR
jgi:hypothetical protein